jgi:hypothetical protein
MVLAPVRPAVKSALVLAGLATFAAAYFNNTPIPLFTVRLKEVALATLVLWSAAGWGNLGLKRLPALSTLEMIFFPIALGLGCLSMLMIGLGVLHAWVHAGGWMLILGGIFISGPWIRTLRDRLSKETAQPVATLSFLPAIAILGGALLSLLLALAPITYYDSLVYHYALPAAYLRAHHWVALPGLIYSAFPQNLEMLWTLGLLIGDDTVANLLAWSLSVLLIGAVVSLARRFLDEHVGLIAGALLAVMPAFLFLSSGGYVDVGLTLYSFLAFYTAMLSRQKSGDVWSLYSGLFAGLAIGIKYTGAVPAVLIGLILIYRRDSIRPTLIYVGSLAVILMPWLIKNVLFVGNPIFPFFYHWGINAMNPWLNQAAAGYFSGISEYYSRSPWQLPGVVWNAAVNGLQFGRGMDVLGDFGWIVLIAFLPALWLAPRQRLTVKRLWLFALGYMVLWGFSRPVLRFLLPLSPILALLVACGWTDGILKQPAPVRWLARGFLTCFVISGLLLFFYATSYLSSWGVALGFEDKASYLSRHLNYYPAALFINSGTPVDSHVYVMGDQRGYYYERDIRITPVFSDNPLTRWTNEASDAHTLRQQLMKEGITHLVVNKAEWDRLKLSYPSLRLTAQGELIWKMLLSSELKTLYRDPACEVYAL